jgi:hypothetical protein
VAPIISFRRCGDPKADVDLKLLNANLILRQMEGAVTRLNVVIFDACRNDPFSGRGLAVGRGRGNDTMRLRDITGGGGRPNAGAGGGR